MNPDAPPDWVSDMQRLADASAQRRRLGRRYFHTAMVLLMAALSMSIATLLWPAHRLAFAVICGVALIANTGAAVAVSIYMRRPDA